MPLAAPELEITDAADGGAVTATIVGGNPAASNAVNYARITGEMGPLDWATLGLRTGPGTIDGTVPKGFYLWQCQSTLNLETVLADLVYQVVTDGDDALHEQILAAVTERATLALSGTEFAVQRVKVPFPANVSMPACIVTTFEQTETDEGGTSGHDYIGRPVYLALTSNDLHDEDTEPALHMARQLLRRAFHCQRLPGVDQVLRCTVEPAQVLLRGELPKVEYQQSAYALRFVTREPRGLGV